MPGLLELDVRKPDQVPVLDVQQPGGDAIPQHTFGGMRHGRAGFARAEHENALKAVEVDGTEVTLDRLFGIGRAQRFVGGDLDPGGDDGFHADAVLAVLPGQDFGRAVQLRFGLAAHRPGSLGKDPVQQILSGVVPVHEFESGLRF